MGRRESPLMLWPPWSLSLRRMCAGRAMMQAARPDSLLPSTARPQVLGLPCHARNIILSGLWRLLMYRVFLGAFAQAEGLNPLVVLAHRAPLSHLQ